MTGKKILLLVSSCTVCSGLDNRNFDRLISQLKQDRRIGKILELDQICRAEQKRKIRSLNTRGSDRAIIASWCSREALGKIPLPKGIDPSLVEVLDLSLYSPKGVKGQPSPEPLMCAIRETAARLALSEPVRDRRIRFSSDAVAVIGSHEGAMRAARALAQHGYKAILIISQKLPKQKDRNIEVIDEAVIKNLDGIPGNFQISYVQHGEEKKVACAAVLLVGERCLADVRPPTNPRVRFVPLERFDEFMSSGAKSKGIVFLDDLGSLTSASDTPVPLWHSLLESAKNAASAGLAEQVSVIARDIKAAGLLELVWKEAAESGVKFIRYDDKSRPKIDKVEPIIMVKDIVLGETLEIPADVIVAPVTTRPWEPVFIERMFVPGDWDVRVRSRGPQRGIGQSPCDGIFVVGYAGFAKLTDQSYPELGAVLSELSAFLNRGYHIAKGAIAVIDEDKCSACNTCVRTCPYRAARMNDRWKAEIIAEKCAGCGNCVGVCPSRAIELKNCTRAQIESQLLVSQEAIF